MKILYISPLGLQTNADYRSEYLVGAIERQIFGLAKEFSNRGHEVFILRRWNSVERIESLSGVNLVNVSVPFFRKEFQEALSFPHLPEVYLENLLFSIKAHKEIKKINPDIVNVSTLASSHFFSRLNLPNSKKVYIFHDYDFCDHGALSWLKRKMLKNIRENFDALVVLTESMKQYMTALGIKINYIIPNGLNLIDYCNHGEKGYILYAGRLVPHKRVDILIKIYSEIVEEIEENLVIIGSGPCENYLKNYATSLNLKDRIFFLRFLPRPKYLEYLSKCSLFILPSEAEAFGVVLIEAMASGKPVIARNIIGPRDIIAHGYNGFLFENNEELTKYLKILLTDVKLRKNMGKNARKIVEQKYTFSRIADVYEKLYFKLVANNN
jgi:glycosyltransferase involved in cell wall biosynthesis